MAIHFDDRTFNRNIFQTQRITNFDRNSHADYCKNHKSINNRLIGGWLSHDLRVSDVPLKSTPDRRLNFPENRKGGLGFGLRYVWMEIFLNLGTKSYGFKNIRIRVDGALVGRENRLKIYWCVFCSILKIFSTHEFKPRC